MKNTLLLLFTCAFITTAMAQVTTYTFENGQKKAEGNLAQGIEQGPWQFWDRDGNLIQEVTYLDGDFHGAYKGYYLSGKLNEEGNFNMSHKHGPFKTYYKNGNILSEGYFYLGFRDSLWTIYYEEGGEI